MRKIPWWFVIIFFGILFIAIPKAKSDIVDKDFGGMQDKIDDSMVTPKYDLVRKPKTPLYLDGDYNPVTKTIILGWYQPPPLYEIDHWNVEYKIYNEPWKLVKRVDLYEGQFIMEVIDVAKPGMLSYLYFRVIAFKKNDRASDPSDLFAVSVDLTETFYDDGTLNTPDVDQQGNIIPE